MITNIPAYATGHNQGYMLAAYTQDDLTDLNKSLLPFKGAEFFAGSTTQQQLFRIIGNDIENLNNIANQLENPGEENVLQLVNDYHELIRKILSSVKSRMSRLIQKELFEVHRGVPGPLFARIEKDMTPIIKNHFKEILRSKRDFASQLEHLSNLLANIGHTTFKEHIEGVRESCAADNTCNQGGTLGLFISNENNLPVLDILIAALKHEEQLKEYIQTPS